MVAATATVASASSLEVKEEKMDIDANTDADADTCVHGVVEHVGETDDCSEAGDDGNVQNRESKNSLAAKPSSKASSDGNSAVVYSPELLQMYYARLFPYGLLHSWLSYGNNTHLFSKREFSFTIEPTPGEEVYIRYQSFHGEKELAQAIMKRRPTKIDIGAIFSHPPKDHNTVQKGSFQPTQRELVFDIDLTDYDDVRMCGCTGASICCKCWDFMKMAVRVIDCGLKEDFGFQHVCWFYSGRRGVHAWVSDEQARELTDAGRSAVANYFEVNLGSDKNKDVHLPHPLHPMLARAHDVLEPMFIKKVLPASGHGLLASEEKWNKLLDSLPETANQVRDMLKEEWRKTDSTPAEKWDYLKTHIRAFLKTQNANKSGKGGKASKSMATKDHNRLENWPVEIVFKYTYPRLDVNVSKMRNHLLKSPFCVHPKTGRVCVPFLAKEVDNFDPFQVPTLSQLMNELDDYGIKDENTSNGTNGTAGSTSTDWKKTSLKDYFEPFQNDFLPALLKSVRKKERDNAEKHAAMTGDF